jgi:hypothetical protein
MTRRTEGIGFLPEIDASRARSPKPNLEGLFELRGRELALQNVDHLRHLIRAQPPMSR